MKKITFRLTLIFVLFARLVLAQDPAVKSMDSIVELFIKENCFNGDLLVTANRKPIYERAVGYQDIRTKENLRHNSVFNIGSISKPITAVAVLQLQEKKLLNVNDEVKKYLPQFPYDSVCIKHLLSHTSGLPTDLDFLEESDLNKPLTGDSIIGLLIKYKIQLLFRPGHEFGYSNIGYDLLALVVEQVSKKRFPAYVNTNVFAPASMHRSFIPTDKYLKKWLPKGVNESDLLGAHMYDNITSCKVVNIDSVKSLPRYDHHMIGSGNVYSCVYDLEKFDKALRDNVILSKKSQQLAYAPFVLTTGDTAKDMQAPIPSYYGLGWFVSIDTSWGKIIWHKGRSLGSRSVYLRNPQKKQTVTFTDNFDYTAVDLKGIACLKILNHQPYRNPVLMSFVRKFGCFIYSGGFEFAVSEFNRLKTTERKNYYIAEDEMIAVAYRLYEDKRPGDALSVLNFCKGLYPSSASVFLAFGDIELQEKEPEDALKSYKTAVSFFSSDESEKESLLNGIGYQFLLANRLNDAEQVLHLNTLLFPNSCNAYDSYATALEKNNKLDQAIANEEKAVSIATDRQDELLPTLVDNLKMLKSKKQSR